MTEICKRIVKEDYNTSRNKQVTAQIPNNVTRLVLYFNEGGGLYEVELSD